MKKMIAMVIGLMLCTCVFSSAGALEITEEYIANYGIPHVDETGAQTILVPLDMEGILTHESGGAQAGMRHILLEMPHTHHIHNIRKTANLAKYQVLSLWADQKMTISFERGREASVSLSVNLESGASENDVESKLGVQIGGTVSYTATETYSATVPEGYCGRLVYRVNYDSYLFDDTLTCYPPGIPNYSFTETYYDLSAEAQPRNAFIYMELKDRDEFFN